MADGQVVDAVFHDGTTADRIDVQVTKGSDGTLLIRDAAGVQRARWPLADVREQRDHGFHKAIVLFHPDRDARLLVTGRFNMRLIREVCPSLRRSAMPQGTARKLVIWSTGAVAALGLLYFVILPGLAERLAVLVPPEQEEVFGEAVVGQIERFLGGEDGSLFCETDKGRAALDAMTATLMQDRALPYDLSVRVFDDEMINAFAVPGGKVVLMRGLIEAAESPDEVAAVLAHEIGHVAARDPIRAALRTAGSAGILSMVFGDFAGGAVVVLLTEQFLHAQYSQALEAAADDYAIAMMQDAGLPPGALGDMFERLREEHGEMDGVVSAFLSHPQLSERIRVARAADAEATASPVLDDEDWQALRAICAK